MDVYACSSVYLSHSLTRSMSWILFLLHPLLFCCLFHSPLLLARSFSLCSSHPWLFSCFSFDAYWKTRISFFFVRCWMMSILIIFDLQLTNAREYTLTNWQATKCTIFHFFHFLLAFFQLTIDPLTDSYVNSFVFLFVASLSFFPKIHNAIQDKSQKISFKWFLLLRPDWCEYLFSWILSSHYGAVNIAEVYSSGCIWYTLKKSSDTVCCWW